MARYLAYHFGLNVRTVEAVSCHLTAASKFDRQILSLDEITSELIYLVVCREVENDLCKMSGNRDDDSFGSGATSKKGTLKHVEAMVSAIFVLGAQMVGQMTDQNKI